MNDDEFASAIDAGLSSLEARPVKPRGCRAILTAQVERMKQAIERGYTVSEIIAELKIHGAHVSRALINQILKPAEAKVRHKTGLTNKTRQSFANANKMAPVQMNEQLGEQVQKSVAAGFAEQGSKAYAD